MPDATTDMRSFMATFPTGVAVITAIDADRQPRGMTCSSLCSVALAPATLMVSLRTVSPTLAAALDGGEFAVNLLHGAARHVSELFSSGAPDRFARVRWGLPEGAGGPHLGVDAHAIADCLVSRTLRVGDHTAVFGEVERTTVYQNTITPLLYGQRRYARWAEPTAVPVQVSGAGRVQR